MKKIYIFIFLVLMTSTIFAEDAPKFIYNDEVFEIGNTNVYILEKLGSPNRIYYEAFEPNQNFDLVSYEYKDDENNITVFSFYRGEEIIVRIESNSSKFGISYLDKCFFCNMSTKNDIEKLLGKGILVYLQEDGTKIYEYEYSNEYTKWFTFITQFFFNNNIVEGLFISGEF